VSDWTRKGRVALPNGVAADGTIRIVSWNMHGCADAWRDLVADPSIDVALVQEAKQPPANCVEQVTGGPWLTGGSVNRPWATAVAQLSNRVRMTTPWPVVSVNERKFGEVGASRTGTLAAAQVKFSKEEITVVSMYGAWEDTAIKGVDGWRYADASVHRVISDLSTLIATQKGHQIIAAGDLNILYGYGENGSKYWKARYDTIFARMEALGLPFIGPQARNGGCQAHSWPKELPADSMNVPTYRSRIGHHETARRQMDFVFASESLKNRLTVRALNTDKEWGPSDHCRVLIELQAT
jgi:exonuclease III